MSLLDSFGKLGPNEPVRLDFSEDITLLEVLRDVLRVELFTLDRRLPSSTLLDRRLPSSTLLERRLSTF